MSRLHRVLELEEPGLALVEDTEGSRHRVSLLALDGPAPEPGAWLVVHSGYAIDRVSATEAEITLAELRRARSLLGPAVDPERAATAVSQRDLMPDGAGGER